MGPASKGALPRREGHSRAPRLPSSVSMGVPIPSEKGESKDSEETDNRAGHFRGEVGAES